MDYQLMNQTLAFIKREIDQFLADFSDDHPYQMAMSLPYFRQTLEAKIVSKVLNRKRVIPGDNIEPFSPQIVLKLLGERVFIEDEICLMIPHIIQDTHLNTIAVDSPHTSYHFMTNLQDIIQNSSFNLCQLFNLKRKEIIGKYLLFFVPQCQWKKFYYYLEKIKKNIRNKEIPEVWSMRLETFQPQTSTSKQINVEIETTAHRNCQDEIIGLHWLLHDLSQQHVNHQQNYQDISPINWATCRGDRCQHRENGDV